MALAAIAAAQPARTTIADTLFRADGSRFSGSVTCSWPSFQTADGYNLSAGNITLRVSNGSLSGLMVPTDSLSGSSANARYTCTYALSNGQPISPPLRETWNVPTAGPAALDDLRDPNPPTPSVDAAAASAPFVTYAASSSLSAERSLGGLADNAFVVCDVAAASCTPRAGLASDLLGMTGWPAGLDLTELGYVNGVTSGIQTQLDAKVATSLTLTGGTGIAAIGDLSTNRTISVDTTELTDQTFGAAGAATYTWTFNLSTGTDPTLVARANAFTTPNLFTVCGTTTEYALNVLCNGSFGTARFYGGASAPTTLRVQKGGSQGSDRIFFIDDGTDVLTAFEGDGSKWCFYTFNDGYKCELMLSATNDGGVLLGSESFLRFFDGEEVRTGTTWDVGVDRDAAGVIGITNGYRGGMREYRDLALRSLNLTDQTEPTCDSTTRGKLNADLGGAGVADTVRACVKLADDTYEWRPLL